MLKQFFKKLFKLSTKEVVKDAIKSENTEDTTTIGKKKPLSNLTISTTTSLSSLMEFHSSSMDLPSKTTSVFEGDVWFLEDL
jgi:hypothetical protein